ncbi:D-alanyl-D-alanine carboxypeptidase family protein [Anaeromassilibacillus senegalensis]|uniref:D-alanyl-D-alanine carboxypeptidase family protein n=1 Tax=Anaeromassilibacillus senegalensis TaxID=1673717 RepID=UPI0006812807|nr:D-alanyl-D-alanine carboxypeptidase family protein [Anaeromassilibacillus senegalensis]
MKKKLFPLLCLVLTVCMLVPSYASAATFNIDFETNSAAIELINLDTDTIVYQKNADAKRAPASTTKIMSFIVVSEQIEDLENTQVTVTKEVVDRLLGTGSSLSGIKENDVLTVMQLLNCMMVPSGNDAALVLADYIGNGNANAFVELMNQKAQELGCVNTHFMNPHGLHDDNHYTTAHDLYLITKYAMTLPHFTDITDQTRYTYTPAGGPEAGQERTLVTTNRLIDPNLDPSLYYRYARGIKTGSHDQAGYCLVSSATKGGYSYMCVALGSPSVDENGNKITNRGEMIDSKNLYEWAFNNLEMKDVLNSEDSVGEIQLDYAWNKDKLLLVPAKNYSTIMPDSVDVSSVILTKNLPESVEAPIKKGDKIGTATLSYAGQELATVDLVAAESVERSELLHSVDTVKSIFTSTWFLVIAGIILVLVLIYIVLALIYNRKKKNLRKVKKYRRM